jgi:hypothetical protein
LSGLSHHLVVETCKAGGVTRSSLWPNPAVRGQRSLNDRRRPGEPLSQSGHQRLQDRCDAARIPSYAMMSACLSKLIGRYWMMADTRFGPIHTAYTVIYIRLTTGHREGPPFLSAGTPSRGSQVGGLCGH